ncbi:murein DD-endopeptidase MepM [uncultured Oceanisphaera sp.]|uniref:murein DD-endopeptidase MepM n=1 Tax=uncultured Oceanisphaera sp. TaxID=353858 RepID=UPI002626DF43|nr:murein DD-endopeptidase MepM [uncultured Oceanisphaera sp.]
MNPLRPIQSKIQAMPAQLPRRHLYGIILLGGLTLTTAVMLPSPGDLVKQPVKISIPASMNLPKVAKEQVDNTEFYTLHDDALDDMEPVDALDEIAASEPEWQEYQVQNGDTLSTIFNGLGLPLATMYKLLEADRGKALDGLKPGQTLSLLIDQDNLLQEFKIKRDLLHTRIFTREGDGYQSRLRTEESNWESRALNGVINGSFYISARDAGLSAGQIQRVANLFQWQLNFARDLRQGDRFKVLVQREFVEGQSTGKSELQAVEITNKGRSYFAFRHEDGKFYDGRGESLERGFIRIPLERRARLSSSFNLNRKHPITGRIRPHKGTDFAVPVGTPVLAPGDGVVVRAVRHRLAGNYLVIRHGRQYTTRFLHLSKFLVKQGDTVRRGQRIALSGNTGRSTGPHLHYEFLVNNRAVDAMQVKLPMANGLGGTEKRTFLATVEKYRQELDG